MKSDALKKLLEQQSRLEARIQQLKSQEQNQERKNETRRKMIAGAFILEKHRTENTMDELVKGLDVFLQNRKDRMLFGLEIK